MRSRNTEGMCIKAKTPRGRKKRLSLGQGDLEPSIALKRDRDA